MGGVTPSVVLPSDDELESLAGAELDAVLLALDRIVRQTEHAIGVAMAQCDRTGRGYNARRDHNGLWTIIRPDGSEIRSPDAA